MELDWYLTYVGVTATLMASASNNPLRKQVYAIIAGLSLGAAVICNFVAR